MTRPDRIPDPRQKICYWVGQTHSFSFIPRSLPALIARLPGEPAGMPTTVISSQLSAISERLFGFIGRLSAIQSITDG
jgi:hypothetical protein